MARVRNIAPGFFTNEELVELPFEDRLLFAGLWTLADREGRLEDRPKRIRMAVFPCDSVDVDACLQRLQKAGLVLRYTVHGVAYLAIPAFHKHQKPHPREAASVIPAPEGMAQAAPTPPMQAAEGEPKASPRQTQGEPRANLGVGEPGGLSDSRTLGLSEQEEKIETPATDVAPSVRGCRIPDGFPDADAVAWCRTERDDLSPTAVVEKFRDYWLGVPGAKGRKVDWPATWRNFVRNERSPKQARASPYRSAADERDERDGAFMHALTGGLAGRLPTQLSTIDADRNDVPRLVTPRG
jgi:hypothetical protein